MENDEKNPFISNVKYSKEYKLPLPKTPKNDRFISAGDRRVREALFRDSLRETTSEECTPIKPLYNNGLLTPLSKRKSISTTPIKQAQRMISKTPEMILDAPEARDDYYCSLLDWSSRDQIVIALDKKCILKDKSTIINLYKAPEYINTCKFSPSGTSLGVASENSMVIQDLESLKINTYHHENGVSTLIFKSENEFVCGDNLGDLHFWDRRKNHSNSLLGFHRDRVVGMCVQKSLLATGGNGNFINIWDERRQDKPVFTFKEHTSATRALTFCPFRDIIASGGGLDDCTIKLHSLNTGKLIKSIDVDGQVCALQWSLHYKELLSAQAAQEQMTLYRFPALTPFFSFQGHTNRTMDMALSPDGQTIVTLGDDETLKFWKCFEVRDGATTLKSPYHGDSTLSIR